MPRQPTSPFTPKERDLIRLELMPRFGQDPDLANGLFLRIWHSGPNKGEPKIPKAIQTMLDRGLVRIGTNPIGRPAGDEPGVVRSPVAGCRGGGAPPPEKGGAAGGR